MCVTGGASGTAMAKSEPNFDLSANQLEFAVLEPGESVQFAKGQIVEVSFEQPEGWESRAGYSSRAAVPAPNCIVAKAEKGFIQVYNNCGGTDPQRVKVVLAFGPDTECKSIEPGTRSNIGLKVGRIDGVYLC